MKPPLPPTLSEHLLWHAQAFLFYPDTKRRTENNLAAQERWDNLLREVVEWRSTFIPKEKERRATLAEPVLLDELFSRDLLKAVPEIVQRTLRLSNFSLADVGDEEPSVYLREAATCYIMGLPQAAVVLARAALEESLRNRVSSLFGAQVAAVAKLRELIDDHAKRGRLLSKEGQDLAHKVRRAADDVLHKKPTDSEQAFAGVEAARTILLELRER